MSASSYAKRENDVQIAWKKRTNTLPDDARRDGIYPRFDRSLPYCLPPEYATLNLLPDVRDGAIALFCELGIPWHDSVDGGPSNHMRDSQVQCVNALFPMVADPTRIVHAFGDVVDIAEVLEIEPGRFLTFEYIGPTDYFGEGNGSPRVRGTRCTSVDAAFRYRTSSGSIELALVEWKYTEQYRATREPNPGYDKTRASRYRPDLVDPDGPLMHDVIDFEYLLDEPFYQLVRQQLLAFRLEQANAEGADTVRILHVLSPSNTEYQSSLVRAEHRALGATVDEVWQKLLRLPDRFLHVDPSVFLDQQTTSSAYVERYGEVDTR